MMKKLLALLMALMMMLSLVPVSAFAEVPEGETLPVYIGDQGYETIDEAIAAAEDGDTITLAADITPACGYVTFNVLIDDNSDQPYPTPSSAGKIGSFTIDGNGHTINGGIADLEPNYDMTEYDLVPDVSVQVTVRNCVVTNGIKFTGKGNSIQIENCTVTGSPAAVLSSGTTTITSGTFTGEYAIGMLGGEVNVSGGVFYGELGVYGGTLTVTGGTFSVDPSDYVPEGYVVTESNGVWTVAKEAAAVAAKIDSTEYATLAAAFAAVKDGETIVLQQDIAEGTITSYTQKTVTVDLNGKTWTATDGAAISATQLQFILVDSEGNGIVTNEGTTGVFPEYPAALFDIGMGSNAQFKGGKLISKGRGLAVVNGFLNCTATFSGATVITDSGIVGEDLGQAIAIVASVTGGTFNVDPSAYVVEGYEATLNESTGLWTVAPEAPAEVEVVEVVKEDVVATVTTDEGSTIPEEKKEAVNTAATAAVEAIVANTEVAKVETKVDEAVKTDETTVSAIIAKAAEQANNKESGSGDAFTAAGAEIDTKTKIEIKLETVKVDAQSVVSAATVENITVNTAVYDVKPIATVTTTVGGETVTETVELTNEDLNGKAVTVRLAVPATGATKAKVTHTSDDKRYADEVFYADIKGNGDNKYVEIQMTHFSTVEVQVLDGETENPVAVIGTTGYATLADAIAAANEAGTATIVMVADTTFTFDTTYATINSGSNITIDLNGKKITSGTTEASGTQLITNKGILTIEDSEGTGVIEHGANPAWLHDGSGDYSGSYASNLIRNEGTLNINGGTLKNISNGSAAYVVDTYINGVTNISGGTCVAAKTAIRLFYGNTALNMTGGAVEAGRFGIISYANASSNNSVTISGGSVNTTDQTDHLGVYAWGEAENSKTSVSISGDADIKQTVLIDSMMDTSAMSITGGTIGELDAPENAKIVSGGTFSTPVPEGNCANGFVPEANEDGTYGVKEANYVAQIGDKKYESLAEAFAAAKNGETIVLLADSDDNITLPVGVTFNTNGKNYTGKVSAPEGYVVKEALGVYTVADYILTIKATAAGSDAEIAALGLTGKDFTADMAKFKQFADTPDVGGYHQYQYKRGGTASGAFGIELCGNVTLTGDTVLPKNAGWSSSMRIYITGDTVIDLNGFTLTQSAGTGQSGYAMFVVDDGATLTIKDSSAAGTGKISAVLYAIQTWPNTNAKVIVEGGTIAADAPVNAIHDTASVSSVLYCTTGEVVFNGGTIEAPKARVDLNGNSVTVVGNELVGNGGDTDVCNGSVSFETASTLGEGTINTNNISSVTGAETAHVKEGFVRIKNAAGTYTITKPVAQIGDTKYATLAEAVAAANQATGWTQIYLIADTAVDETIELNNVNGKGTTLHTNGHVLTANAPVFKVTTALTYLGDGTGALTDLKTDHLFVANGGTIKINQDSVFTSNSVNEFLNQHAQYLVENDGKYTVTPYQVDTAKAAGFVAMTSIDSTPNYFATVQQAADAGNKTGANLIADVTSGSIVAEKYFTLTTVDSLLEVHNYSGSITVPADMNLNIYGTGKVDLANVVCGELYLMNNANVTVANGMVKTIDVSSGTLSITGGIYGVDPTDYVADGYKAVALDATADAQAIEAGYTHKVVPANYVCQIGDVKYESLQAALTAANSGDTIILLADLSDLGSVNLPAGVTLDGNSHKISGNSAVYVNAAGGTVQNVVFENIQGNNLSAIYASGLSGTATITGCSFDNIGWDAIQATPVAGATVTITGNTFRHTAEGTAKRYVHVESAANVDFTATVTGNKFYDCAKLEETGLEVYYPADASKLDCSHNYMDNPIGVCIGTGNSYYNATEKAFPFVAEDMTTPLQSLAAVQVYSASGYNTYVYPTFAQAFEAANTITSWGNTLILFSDVTVTETLVVDPAASMNIDLNGHDITADGVRAIHLKGGSLSLKGTGTISSNVANSASSVIRVGDNNASRYATLTVYNDVTVSTATAYGISAFGANTETVTVYGTVTSTAPANTAYDGCAIATVGTDTTPAKINVKNTATITAENTNAIYLPAGTLNVNEDLNGNSAIITGATGIYVKGGSVAIKGGTITGNGAQKDYQYYGNGGISTGDALVIDNCGYPTEISSVAISGGTFESHNGKQVGAYYGNTETEIANITSTNKSLTVPEGFKWDDTGKLVKCEYVAQIGDVKYETLADAVKAIADGSKTGTIEMIDNEVIEGNAGVTIPKNCNITLDLNGFTVSNLVNEEKASQVITNNGTLTIQDSSDAKTGMLTNAVAEGVLPGEWWTNPPANYATNVILNNGTLTVDSGSIYNTAGGSICYAIDNSSNSGNANLVINGGHIRRVNGSVIRMFCNSHSRNNNVTVTGGIIDGGYAGIWVQLPGGDDTRPANLTVTGGTISGTGYAFYDYSYGNPMTAVNYNISGGIFNGNVFSYGANVNITGGTFNGFVYLYQNQYGANTITQSGGNYGSYFYVTDYLTSENVMCETAGYFMTVVDASYCLADGLCVINNPSYNASVTDITNPAHYPYTIGKAVVKYSYIYNGSAGSKTFADLQEAIDTAAYYESDYFTTDNVITLLDNIDYGVLDSKTTGAKVNAGQSVTLDLNGFTVSGTKTNKEKNVYVIMNDGTLTVVDGSENGGGKILLNQDTTVWNYSTDGVAIENHGNLTVNSGTIEATRTSTGMIYAIDNITGYTGTTTPPSLTVNGGTIRSEYAAIRAYAQNKIGTDAIETVVNGGTIISDWAFFLQDGANSTNTLDVKINGGTFDSGKDMFFLGLCSDNKAKITISEAEGKSIVSDNDRSVVTYDYDGANNNVEIVIDSGKFTYPSADVLARQVNGTGAPGMAISGGYYSFEPAAALIAEGYEAIANDGSTDVSKDTYPWTIGVVPDPVETDKADDFTATKPEGVTDDDVNTEVNNILGNEKVTEEGATNIQEVVVVADKDSQLKIELKALELEVQTVEATTTITSSSAKFDVWPVFIVNGTETLITNDELKEFLGVDGYVSFRLAVPDSMVGENKIVMVSHYPTTDEDAHTTAEAPDWTKAYDVQGEAGGYYVEIHAREFSIYELTEDVIQTTKFSFSLTLEDSIDINFYVKDLAGTPADYTVEYTFKGVTDTVTLNDKDSNKIVVAQCAAKEMGDLVHVVVKYKGAVIKEVDYSVRTYCENKINSDAKPELKALCYATLDYGTAAQKRFGYHTDDPVNAKYVEGRDSVMDATVLSSLNIQNKDGGLDCVSQISTSLTLENKTEINFYLAPNAESETNVSDLVITATKVVNGEEKTIEVVNTPDDGTGRRKVKIPGIAAYELNSAVTLTVRDPNTEEVVTLTYSAMTYAYKRQSTGVDGEVCKALYLYWSAANAFFSGSNG